jgi:hypothetical protein
LEEEKATLEGMVESRDELLMEIARETGLDRMGLDAEDEEEEEDANDGEDSNAPLAAMPPPPMLHAAAHEEIDVILVDAEPEMSWLHLYHALLRDHEESPPMIMDDFADLDDDPNEVCSDMDEWFSKDGSNERD